MALNKFSISRILDRTTLVITGAGVEKLKVGDDLSIVVISGEPGAAGGKLVLPKGRVEVTTATKSYAIVRPHEITETRTSGLFPALSMLASKETYTVKVRNELTVAEGQIEGNPAKEPIKIGDIVIRSSDFDALLAESAEG